MALITKDEYNRRQESAAARIISNAEIKSLTEEQHKLIAEVCNMRHIIHISQKSLYNNAGDSQRIFSFLNEINERLNNCDLPVIPMPQIEDYPSCEDRYSGVIDDNQEAEEKNLEKFFEMIEELNTKIEVWLTQIDNCNSTNYAPTGRLRYL